MLYLKLNLFLKAQVEARILVLIALSGGNVIQNF